MLVLLAQTSPERDGVNLLPFLVVVVLLAVAALVIRKKNRETNIARAEQLRAHAATRAQSTLPPVHDRAAEAEAKAEEARVVAERAHHHPGGPGVLHGVRDRLAGDVVRRGLHLAADPFVGAVDVDRQRRAATRADHRQRLLRPHPAELLATVDIGEQVGRRVGHRGPFGDRR